MKLAGEAAEAAAEMQNTNQDCEAITIILSAVII
jgi:hypothetical protein